VRPTDLRGRRFIKITEIADCRKISYNWSDSVIPTDSKILSQVIVI
jgi:hypothetical protein